MVPAHKTLPLRSLLSSPSSALSPAVGSASSSHNRASRRSALFGSKTPSPRAAAPVLRYPALSAGRGSAMEVPAGQDGIQRLLAAEQEAQAIVTQARKAKADRLKQAKEEAEREVGAYKAQCEEEFKRKVSSDSSSSQQNVVRLAEESQSAVKAIQDSIAQKKGSVMDMLIGHVVKVKQ